MLSEPVLSWQLVALIAVPAFGALFGVVLHTRRQIGDLRVELANYRTRVAERYVPLPALDAFENEVMRRLERIEDKLDAQTKAVAAMAGLGEE